MSGRDLSAMRVVVVGPSWYGNWVDYFYEGLTAAGADARVIYTNTLFGSSIGYASEAQTRLFERAKRVIAEGSPRLFAGLKGVRRAMSERDLLRQLKGMEAEQARTFVVFVWTPPSVRLLQKLRAGTSAKLIYWIGEPLSRDARWRTTLDYFDHLFIIDREEWIGDLGKSRGRASILSLSSTTRIFKPMALTDEEQERYACDVVFVGLYRKERAEMIEPVRNFNFKIYGYGWDGAEKEFPWLAGGVQGPATLEEMPKIFNGAKISIGSLGMSFAEDNLPTLTQRVFDIALSGGFQLSQWSPLTEKVFGESVPLFRSTEELGRLLRHYIAHPEERERLAAASREIALKNTWEDRAREALKVLETLR